MLRALERKEPDLLPIYEIIIDSHIVEKILGRAAKRVREEWQWNVDIKDYYHVHEKLGLDGINIFDGSMELKPLDKETYVDEWARVWKVKNETLFYAGGMINSPDDLKEFSPPDPNDPDRIDQLRRLIKINKKELAITGGIHDAYEIPYQMRGGVNLLIDYYTRPDFARKLIEMSVNYNIELAKAMIDLGVDALVSGDDYAYKHGPFMPPRHFREFILPYLKRIVDVVHKGGVPFIKHCDGYIWPILDDIVKTGIDALHPIEPQAKMSLREVKEKYGDRICVMGNVDVSYVLPFGTVKETIKDVKRCIKEASIGGGHILTSSNSIHSAVKVENFKAMIKTARKYGVYPISI
jgi:uroporphyrinogen decarboxylase